MATNLTVQVDPDAELELVRRHGLLHLLLNRIHLLAEALSGIINDEGRRTPLINNDNVILRQLFQQNTLLAQLNPGQHGGR